MKYIDDLGRPLWNDYFLSLAVLASTRSPDPDTQHGAVLVGPDHRILGIGYNGFPRGCNDSAFPLTRPKKYDFMIHAEMNCILNSRTLEDYTDVVMYVTGHPCKNCFKHIVQLGVKYIIHADAKCKVEPSEKDFESMNKLAAVAFVNVWKPEPHETELLLSVLVAKGRFIKLRNKA